jgi:ADP-ribosylglycohydrolase
VAVQRAPWPTVLAPETVVVLSHAADYLPAPNLACIAPARYRALPSIAYRLALAAAGEGEVVVSLSGPGGWDYAAGHALLLGVGGALTDEVGVPVTYTADGASQTSRCFGGAPALVGLLAERPWRTILSSRAAPRAALDLIWPSPGDTIADDGLVERAQGCLLGQLTGDALGSMVEFAGSAAIRRTYPAGLRAIGPSPVFSTVAGQPTDDSELALVLARTLLRTESYDAEEVAAAYTFWVESKPFDVGNTIGTALRAMSLAGRTGTSRVAAAEAAASHASESNGALMRQSPLAIWGHALDPHALAAAVRADTRLTHPSLVCQDASAAFIVALAGVVREGLGAADAYALAREWHAAHGGNATVAEALAAAADRPPEYERNEGHVLVALQNAFYQALHAPSVEEGVVTTVMAGGDTDTNAAIAGALLGALHGARALPAQWRQAGLTCRPQADAPGIGQPRPRACWPVDALILAERLLVVGREHAGAERA